MGLISELQAINEMLVSAGERPVTSLDNPEADIEVAQTYLDQARREIMLSGKAGNVYTTTLTIGVDDKIFLPTGTLSVSLVTQPYSDRNIGIIAGGPPDGPQYIINVTDNIYTWDDLPEPQELEVVVTINKEFEDIPVALQTYITATAKQRYQMIVQGNPSINNQLLMELRKAMILAEEWNSATKNRNILNESVNPAARILRRWPLSWSASDQRRWYWEAGQ